MIALCRMLLTVAAVTLAAFPAAHAESNRATFPEDFDQYVLYATYDRGASREEAFATPETLVIAKAGKPLPRGTRLVLGIWSDFKLTDYFVMEKGVDWGLEVAEELRTGDWHFQQFDTNRQVRRTAIAAGCQTCHQGAADNDFQFTADRMKEYLP